MRSAGWEKLAWGSSSNALLSHKFYNVLILLPVLLPILTAIGILVAQLTRPKYGITYLIAVLVALLNWGIILSFHWINPPALAISNWLPFPDLAGVIIFQLDAISWPYAFAIASLA